MEDVEAVCEGLAAQQHFLDDIGLRVWPDGTSGGRYRFQHALYQQVLYEQLGTARRRQLHRRIGVRLEAGYGARAGEIAAQLAVHFERGGETAQAVRYWQQAGDNAARRNAHHEAITALTKGLALLATLPESPERAQHELALQLTLGELLRATKGVGAPDVGDVYTRAYTLCQQVGETPQLARVLWGLSQFHMTQGQMATAGELAQQLLDLVQRQPDTGFVVEGHFVMGTMAFYRGDFLAARTHLEQSCRLADTVPSPTATLRGGFVPGVTPRTSLARVLWALGYADQAQQRSQEALALARQGEHLPTSGVCGMLCGPRLPVPPRRGGDPGACRRLAGPGRRATLGRSAPSRGASCGGGRWPCRARRPPGWRTSARGWRLPTWDQSRCAPIGSPCWPRRMAGRGSPRPGSRSWPRP